MISVKENIQVLEGFWRDDFLQEEMVYEKLFHSFWCVFPR